LKILYYITDHGLGHSTRSVAIIKELIKHSDVIIRSNDSFQLLRKSLPQTKILHGSTDFTPIMDSNNSMKFDKKKTTKSMLSWIENITSLITKESKLVKQVKPNLIISDVSFLPIIAAKENNVKSIVISNFVWNEVLDLPKKINKFIYDSYANSTSIIKLPFGTDIKFNNVISFGLTARQITMNKDIIRKNLNLGKKQKLLLLSIGNLSTKLHYKNTENLKIIDLSNYQNINKFNNIDLTEGQNLINAADLIICKCGYGFISECLTLGKNFNYLLEKNHKEAYEIHKNLIENGLNNEIQIDQIQIFLNQNLLPKNPILKLPNQTKQISKFIHNFK
jgi:uncharacterized protein (TIGR00661 family)